ncbi:YaiI/YqxD family protein [Kiloniella sp. b19]|uniref:YaiI/YqxD family protein n=1 Tax=Kiloniella sp. GXU_MW_B19 TaxID=3141326 RepID=UPI0031E2F8E8
MSELLEKPNRIFVDADACPVKDEVIRVAERHKWPVFMVSNVWLRQGRHPLVESIAVPEGADVADDWIAERCGAGDIVVTQDIPLADRAIKAGALVTNNKGKAFTDQSIGMAVAVRDLKTGLREAGEIRDHHPAFSKRDRSDFLNGLERLIQQVRKLQRSAPPPASPR